MNPDIIEDPNLRGEVDPILNPEAEDDTGIESAEVPPSAPSVSTSVVVETVPQRDPDTQAILAALANFELRFADFEARRAAHERRMAEFERDRRLSTEAERTTVEITTPLRGMGSVRFSDEAQTLMGEQTPVTPRASLGGSDMTMLDVPIMGIRLSTTSVLVGGKPRADWSGLDGESAGTPDCRRFVPGTSAEERGYGKRCTIKDFEFSRKCDIYDMMSRLTIHAKTYGLDTTLYVVNPDNPNEVLFVPQYYNRLNHLLEKAKAVELAKKWDAYDKENDAALVTLLRNSLDKDMRASLNPYLDFEQLPASVILMMICNEIKPTTLLSFDNDRAQLMRKKIKSFTGHDVKKFCEAIRPDLRRLEQAHELTKYVLLWLIDCFVEIGVFGFSDEIRRLYYEPTSQTIQSLGDYTQSNLMQTLRAKNIHWEHVLDKATYLYMNIKDAGHWKWSASKDTKASPQFYLNELSDDPETQKIVAAMLTAKNDGKVVCYGCGKVGVKKPDCPTCQKKGDAKKDGNANNKNNNENKNKNNKKGIDHPAPKSGEPQIKVVDNRIYFWCEKCNKWEGTHFPKNHGKSNTKLTTDKLIEIKKEFVNSGKVPADFNFCEVVSQEGINL